VTKCWLQEDRKTHYEGLVKENDELVGRINTICSAQAQQEPKVAKVGTELCAYLVLLAAKII